MAWPDRLGKALGSCSDLRFKCLDCNHTGSMPNKQALKTFGELAMPSEVAALLRCSVCNSKRCVAHL